MMKRVLPSLCVLAGVATLSRAIPQAHGQCEPQWSDQFASGGLSSAVYALASFDDDGNGPQRAALYVGGAFYTAGGVRVNRVARWDGTSWSPLGSGMNEWVSSLAVFDDDGAGPIPSALYAAGLFTTAGGVSVNRIARWDGTSWSPLGEGVTGVSLSWVLTLAVFDDDGAGPHPPALYVGGSFTTAGGRSARNIAKWNGTSWSKLGAGLSGTVNALAVFDDDGPGPHAPALYAGTGPLGGGVARWDGVSWTNLGSGMNDSVYALTGFDDDAGGPHAPALYAGGGFRTAGGVTADYIAKWDGTSWSAVANGLSSPVYALTVFDDDAAGPRPPGLYAGGGFRMAGGVAVNGVARWDGTSWSSLGSGMSVYPRPDVNVLSVFDDDGDGPNPPALYAAGEFTTAGGISSERIARWGTLVPYVRTHPYGQAVAVGQKAVFSVRAGGQPPLDYQWYKDGVALSNGGNISGAMTDTLTIDPIGPPDVAEYDVAVTNACGSITSAPATLWLLGDLNCDKAVNFDDIDPFVLALGGQSGYLQQYPDCNWLNADCNQDGTVDFADIDPFVALLGG